MCDLCVCVSTYRTEGMGVCVLVSGDFWSFPAEVTHWIRHECLQILVCVSLTATLYIHLHHSEKQRGQTKSVTAPSLSDLFLKRVIRVSSDPYTRS